VLLGRGLCDGLIIFPEESYRVCLRVVEVLHKGKPGPTGAPLGLSSHEKNLLMRNNIFNEISDNAGKVRQRRKEKK
jgi:hypothetical protein